MDISLGLGTFGDITRGPDGALLSDAQVIRNVVEEGVLAERSGLDSFGIGEHHRADFAVSSPEPILAAIAARTSRIRLHSAVTVLSSDDPVRVFQRFATLDALSSGRAEAILGRGSFTESFPLFGQELTDYDLLFEDRLDLFAQLLRGGRTTWSGKTRAALTDQGVWPQIQEGRLSTWIGVGGSPESVVRAVRYNMPMMLAIIGGAAARFRPFVDLYHRAFTRTGVPPQPLGVQSHGFVGRTDESAADALWPHYSAMMNRIGAERGWSPMQRAAFDGEIAQGALYVGAPETVARRIVGTVRTLGLARFDIKYSHGTLPHEELMETIALYGEKVVPMVRDMLSGDPAPMGHLAPRAAAPTLAAENAG